jgi:hypothetical protein
MLRRILRVIPTYPRKNSLGINPIKCRNYSKGNRVPSKISIANIIRNFSLGKFVFYYGYSKESTKKKFLAHFPTYSWKNSDLLSEIFQPILGKFPRNFSMLTPWIFCFTGDGSSEECYGRKYSSSSSYPGFQKKLNWKIKTQCLYFVIL